MSNVPAPTDAAMAQRWGPRAAFVLLIVVIMTFLMASSAPSPLYALYREAWGFAPVMMAVVFAIYSAGLLASLLTVGGLSDYVGRRPVIVAALALQALAMLTFLLADSLAWLLAARLIQGFATGMATSAVGAMLVDVARQRGTLANSVAPMTGTALGAIVASACVQFLPAPLHLIFMLLLVAFVVQGVLAWRLPPTIAPRPGALASLRPSVLLPPQTRSALWRTTPINVANWALGGFSLSLGPSLARAATGMESPMFGGAYVMALFGVGALSSFFLRAASARAMLLLAGGSLLAGVAIELLGVRTGSATLFFLGLLIAGVAMGCGFSGVLRTVLPTAEPHERAGVMSTLLIVSYLATSLPAILAGALLPRFGLVPVSEFYGLALIVLGALALWTTATLREAPPMAAPPSTSRPCL